MARSSTRSASTKPATTPKPEPVDADGALMDALDRDRVAGTTKPEPEPTTKPDAKPEPDATTKPEPTTKPAPKPTMSEADATTGFALALLDACEHMDATTRTVPTANLETLRVARNLLPRGAKRDAIIDATREQLADMIDDDPTIANGRTRAPGQVMVALAQHVAERDVTSTVDPTDTALRRVTAGIAFTLDALHGVDASEHDALLAFGLDVAIGKRPHGDGEQRDDASVIRAAWRGSDGSRKQTVARDGKRDMPAALAAVRSGLAALPQPVALATIVDAIVADEAERDVEHASLSRGAVSNAVKRPTSVGFDVASYVKPDNTDSDAATVNVTV